jgi:NAD(P)-dependent dehydrogenase (short-subunit alcohol dehydrogenase family)
MAHLTAADKRVPATAAAQGMGRAAALAMAREGATAPRHPTIRDLLADARRRAPERRHPVNTTAPSQT